MRCKQTRSRHCTLFFFFSTDIKNVALAFIFIQNVLLCKRKWIKRAPCFMMLYFNLDQIAAALLILVAFIPKTNIQRGITHHYHVETLKCSFAHHWWALYRSRDCGEFGAHPKNVVCERWGDTPWVAGGNRNGLTKPVSTKLHTASEQGWFTVLPSCLTFN